MERTVAIFWSSVASVDFSFKMLATIIACCLLVPCYSARQSSSSYDDPSPGYDSRVPDYQYGDQPNEQVYDLPTYGDDEPHMCYSCEFTLLEDGHIEGFENCNEPFLPDDIPQIQCKHPCSKKLEIHSKYSYSVRRMCTPNCKDRSVRNGGYTKCCSRNLCNGYSTFHSLRDNVLVVMFGILLAIWTASWL